MLLIKDSCGSSEEETSAGAMAQSGKLEESDDDFNSNLFSVDTAIISVQQSEIFLFPLNLFKM